MTAQHGSTMTGGVTTPRAVLYLGVIALILAGVASGQRGDGPDRLRDPLPAGLSVPDEDDTDNNNASRPVSDRRRAGPCLLTPVNDHYDQVSRLNKDGSQKLKLKLSMIEYIREERDDPLAEGMTRLLKPYEWQRVFSKHGRTLLSLAFNYDVLSLQMLTFGTETLQVDVLDTPQWCFSDLTPEEKVDTLRRFVMTDLKVPPEGSESELRSEHWVNDEDFICTQVVKNTSGGAIFGHECCTGSDKAAGEVECTDNSGDTYIAALYVLVSCMKVGFLLFGPLYLQRWMYSESIRTTDYVIKLRECLLKTLLVKKVYVDSSVRQGREMRQFSKFRSLIKSVRSDEIVNVHFKKLHIQVDHKKLMTEKNVPVGLFRFLYENFLQCGIQRFEPFTSCCAQSICGSWSKYFLWLPLRDNSDCNKSCRYFMSWGRIFKMLGSFLLILAIPIPYYIRLAMYYHYEADEITLRKEVADALDLDMHYDHNLFQYVSPTHGGMVVLYIFYFLTFALLGCFRAADKNKFDSCVRGSLQDLRSISRIECFRLGLAHLLLPLEKFGLCGLLLGAIYWPIVLPLCVIVAICYCVPTLYLMGRFLIPKRPSWLATLPYPSPHRLKNRRKELSILSNGTSSVESALLLDNISPRDVKTPDSPSRIREPRRCCGSCDKSSVGHKAVDLLVGLLCILLMICVLVIFAECFGFAVEMCVLTMMGIIVNASSAARYAMLVFWIMMYSSNCYNGVYKQYLKLNSKLFDFIKTKLNEDVQAVTRYREDKQQNTAFKYFTTQEMDDEHRKEQGYELYSTPGGSPAKTPAPVQPTVTTEIGLGGAPSNGNDRTNGQPKTGMTTRANRGTADNIEFQNDRLHWVMHGLVFFVDKKDVPRIPREFFRRICDIQAPGCPGPVYASLAHATRQLSYMIIFLVFVVLVVMSFGDFYGVSSTNQMLLTLASGFLPFVVRFVLTPSGKDLDLNTYSFTGKIHNIIRSYQESWPVYDLSFKPWAPDLGGGSDIGPGTSGGASVAEAHVQRQRFREGEMNTGGPDVLDPTHVDLLITIKADSLDELDYHNLRSEPASMGSHGSLNSGANRASPDDNVTSTHVPHTATNQPTNATPFQQRPLASSDPSSLVSAANQPRNLTPSPSAMSGGQSTAPPGIDLVIDMTRDGPQVHPDPGRLSSNIPLRPMAGGNAGQRRENESAL